MPAIFIGISSCGKQLSDENVDSISTLYAEILLEKSIGNEDDGKVDSLLKANGYENVADFQQSIKQLAQEDPEGLRAVFDSTQKRLEKIRDRTESEEVVVDDEEQP